MAAEQVRSTGVDRLTVCGLGGGGALRRNMRKEGKEMQQRQRRHLQLAAELRQRAAEERSQAARYDTLQQDAKFSEMWRLCAQNSLRRAERLESLAAQAEAGNWPPPEAHICIQCATGADPEEGRCDECSGVDCCGPSPSWAKSCEVCLEQFCPECGRWIPNCQRGL